MAAAFSKVPQQEAARNATESPKCNYLLCDLTSWRVNSTPGNAGALRMGWRKLLMSCLQCTLLGRRLRQLQWVLVMTNPGKQTSCLIVCEGEAPRLVVTGQITCR